MSHENNIYFIFFKPYGENSKEDYLMHYLSKDVAENYIKGLKSSPHFYNKGELYIKKAIYQFVEEGKDEPGK